MVVVFLVVGLFVCFYKLPCFGEMEENAVQLPEAEGIDLSSLCPGGRTRSYR